MFDVFRKSLQVERKSAGHYEGGYWQQGEVTSCKITASIQATDVELLQTLPEGYRTRTSYTLITDSKLSTADDGKAPDIVIIDEKRFIVIAVMPWQNIDGMGHYEVIVVRENIDSNDN